MLPASFTPGRYALAVATSYDEHFPDGFFDRIDSSSDADFYANPRMVAHIDQATIDALSEAYRELLPAAEPVLDLMSSCISHLPEDVAYPRVAGLGMNTLELDANPRLDDAVVRDLNRDPTLPYPDASFGAVVNAVSIQYLIRPVEVFADVCRVLRPGGIYVVATSHRMFPTKAIRAWHVLPPGERVDWIQRYFELAGGFAAAEYLDRSPGGTADPLWLVLGRKN